jgi:hypothetical protein
VKELETVEEKKWMNDYVQPGWFLTKFVAKLLISLLTSTSVFEWERLAYEGLVTGQVLKCVTQVR